jgi:hypothetical protein
MVIKICVYFCTKRFKFTVNFHLHNFYHYTFPTKIDSTWKCFKRKYKTYKKLIKKRYKEAEEEKNRKTEAEE